MEKTWYDELLDAAKDTLREELSGIQASGEIAGVDFTVGRLPGLSLPTVAVGLGVLVVLLVLFK